jgi:2-oxoglutarate ferredoxin oxidoreductase subunit beta
VDDCEKFCAWCLSDFPVAVGVIRDVETETYDEAMTKQIEEVQAKSKIKTFDDLIDSCEQWDM